MPVLKYHLLNTPLIIWGLQLLYVALALGLFAVLLKVSGNRFPRLPAQIGYVVAMIVINIIWRMAIRRLKPDWWT